MASLRLLLNHCCVMADEEQDVRLREQWTAMADEIREYLSPSDDVALPGL